MGCRGQSKEFPDKRTQEKERRLIQKRVIEQSKKPLKDSKRETKAALDQHSLGWKTNDGKEL